MGLNKEQIIASSRSKISEIDREILTLIKRREQLSSKIGRAKRELLIPDRDFAREKQVFEQTIKTAKELNLSVDLAVSLQKLIIESSLSRQEKDRIKHNLDSCPKSVLVVGGSGRLGTWLSNFFIDSGHRVSVVDLVPPSFQCNFSIKLDENANVYDIIVLATPIRASIRILEQLCTLKLFNPTIFDVSSIKAPVQKSLLKLKSKGLRVTSLHPMFGPTVRLLFGHHLIRTSLGCSEADAIVDEIFSGTSLKVLDMSIRDHDYVISLLLGLCHIVNIAFVHTLNKSEVPISSLQQFSSPTFSHLLKIATAVLNENHHLYFEIQALNPFSKTMYQHHLKALSELTKAIESLDEDRFVEIMKSGHDYLCQRSKKEL